MIRTEQDLLAHLEADTREQFKRRLYKHTDCGAWVEFKPYGVHVGSIVEGCDFGTRSYILRYPFTETAWGRRIDLVEREATALWEWANVTRDRNGRRHRNGRTDAERDIDAPALDGYFKLEQGPRSS